MAESDTRTGPVLSPSQVPQETNIVFEDTSFFVNGNKSLPAPSEVRHAAGLLEEYQQRRPLPVSFPAQRLIVKWGSGITIAEGQCLWYMKHFLPSVPVPEVYGWCLDGGQTFIFMELVDGRTLEQEWPEMDPEDRYLICKSLGGIISDLRQLRQEPGVKLIGDINHQPLHEVLFDFNQPAGPFEGVPAFHDWITALKRGIYAKPGDVWREGMLDDARIVFTHADLHRSNIMVSRDANGNPFVSAMLDWHQSGWYPETWEFYKTRRTCKRGEMWELEFILEFLQAYQGYMCCLYYTDSLG